MRRSVALRASEKDAASTTDISLPAGRDETVQQATAAINAALADGNRLLDVEFLLPLIGATDLDDWPGGVRQQFKAAAPMVEDILRNTTDVMAKGGCKTEILDDADAIGLWDGKAIATVLFPTADVVDDMMALAKAGGGKRPFMFVNKQWAFGQIISDFGFGPWKERRMNFIDSFTTAYCLKQFRVLGENIRILYAYPGKWQVFVISEAGEVEAVGQQDARPAYKELEAMLRAREGSIANQSIFERLSSEFKFNKDSLKEQKIKE